METNSESAEADKRPYRECAGAVLFNSTGSVLAGERYGVSGSWQFVQGGIESGESPEEAARREVEEEIGVPRNSTVLVKTLEPSFTYNFPANLNSAIARVFCGQRMHWSVFYWDGDLGSCILDQNPDGHPEFTKVAWMGWDTVIGAVHPMKREMYLWLRDVAQPLTVDYLKASH